MGNIVRINNALEGMNEKIRQHETRLAQLEGELKNAQEEADRPFPKEDEADFEDGDTPAPEPPALSVVEGGKPSIRAAIRSYTPTRPSASRHEKKPAKGGGAVRRTEGRTVGLYTKVSLEKKEVIEQKMALLGTTNLRAYLRKMAVNGYIVQLDMSGVVELVKLLRSISSSVNQIARRCNSTRNLYAQDVEDLRQGYNQVWQGISDLLKKYEAL